MRYLIVFISALSFATFLIGCSSVTLIYDYKNQDIESFQASRLLVVGITADKEAREFYETTLVESLKKEGVNTLKSINFFENSFTDQKQSHQQLDAIEKKLLRAGVDAVLFTKITNRKDRVTLVNAYQKFTQSYQIFKNYYYNNQSSYLENKHEQVYTIETSLFCICSGQECELIWRGEMEVIESKRLSRHINRYKSLLFKTLKQKKLVLN
ncbi:hypothetical protein [Psychroflexus sp. MES1-P1E]|uniref:hypothetical protein n=1 Tax=Psychroflexus sp. MES1-P1E TaxID=2058320 RepID=UPI0011AE3952|nr:hypothetical protein [Psychroflexus sp. MES1-P1E]